MMRSKFIISTLVSALLLVGCGGESQRSTSNSSDLTGLWRMNLDSNHSGLNAKSNISFTLTETADGLTIKDCSGRSDTGLNKQASSIEGMPVSPFIIINNDTLNSSHTLGDAEASKMSLAAMFDMGDLMLSSSELGSLNFSDLCVLSSSARVLGVTANDNISATTMLNGEPLLLDLVVMGNLKKGEFELKREPGLGDASIRLQSESLKPVFNRSELTLTDGVLTITEDSVVWTKGLFSGIMPNGSTLTGTFSFEKP